MPYQIIGNGNHVNTMYAGALFTLGKFAGSTLHLVTFYYIKFFPIVKEVNIRFRRPALTDVVMEVDISEEEAETLLTVAQEKGKADFSRNLALIDVSGETMAEVKGVWQIRPIWRMHFSGVQMQE